MHVLTRFPKSKENDVENDDISKSTNNNTSSSGSEETYDNDLGDDVEEDSIYSSTLIRKGRRLRNRLHSRTGEANQFQRPSARSCYGTKDSRDSTSRLAFSIPVWTLNTRISKDE